MLPVGFHWASRYQYDKQRTALVYRGKQVANFIGSDLRTFAATQPRDP
ncbi:hypothetical protein [Luteimonas sp. A501]